jgi:NADH/NAD ratio-sensing transcriptional regulator Rex
VRIKILKDIVINGSVELAGTIVAVPDDQAKKAVAFLVAESAEPVLGFETVNVKVTSDEESASEKKPSKKAAKES